MKHLVAKLAVLLLVSLWSQAAGAQEDGAASWVKLSPKGERFGFQMPKSPDVRTEKNSYEGLTVDARLYTVSDKRASYTVWSLKNRNYAEPHSLDSGTYLDACAELVWESLLKPLRNKLANNDELDTRMAYTREIEGSVYPGREYSVVLGNRTGIVQFYINGEAIYVLTVLTQRGGEASARRFIQSFSFTTPATKVVVTDRPGQAGDTGRAIGPGRAGADVGVGGGGPRSGGDSSDSTDYNRTFTAREVTQKARILYRPEPLYTESARKFQVQGTVIIRAIISETGQIVNLKAVTRLPHGLTQSAIEAARLIRFTPAQKDGREVAQYIQIEYNFNLY